MKVLIVIGVLFGLLASGIATVFFMDMNYDNTEIELRTVTYGQQRKCRAYFDKMWKILQEKAGVADQYKESFHDIYADIIAGRYSKGDGALMKWITESNPQFDASLYKDVMNSIESQREGFFNEQTMLIDMKAQHDMLLLKAPSRWFMDPGIKPIDIIIITSANTNKAYETGEENDIDLFKKDTTKK